jgi:DNA invertase Pin-like site-specific DNA recombinase
MNTTKYITYCRKSTDEPDRQILSIEAQITELREFAEREHLEIIQEFVESQTAKEPGRPIFNQMLSLIEKGFAQGILAWHPDRLARNSVDGGRIIYLIDTGKIRELKFRHFGLTQPRRENLCSISLLGNPNTMLIIFRRM